SEVDMIMRNLILRRWRSSIVVTAGALLLASASGIARSADQPPAAPATDASLLATARFFTGSVGHTGQFPGKLVCLRCDLNPSSEAKAQCEKEGHRHALQIQGDPLLHPLLGVSEDILKQINSDAMHDKQVLVTGTYYPATGAVLVSAIE